MHDEVQKLIDDLLRRGLEPRLSVRAAEPEDSDIIGPSRAVAELTGMHLTKATSAVENQHIVLHSVSPDEARAAVRQIESAGGLARIELGLIERYAFVPGHPQRGMQICERLSILDGDLLLTRGQLAQPPDIRTLLHDAHVSELLAGFDRERARWAAAGMVDVANEIELLQAVSAREPQLEAELRAADERFIECATVYGDWLQAQGDARGLLAPVSLRLQTSNDEEVCKRATQELAQLVDEHASHVLGSLHRQLRPNALTWCGPVLRGVTLEPGPQLGRATAGPNLRARPKYLYADELHMLHKLLALPVSVALQWLELEGRYARHPDTLATLAAAPCAATLLDLWLWDVENLRVSGVSFDELLRLTLGECWGDLHFELRLPNLCELSVAPRVAPDELVECFAGLDAPELEDFTLKLYTHKDAEGHAYPLPQLERVFGLPSFARLRELTLTTISTYTGYSSSLDGIDDLLARIPARATLERVDLSGARLDTQTRARLAGGSLGEIEVVLD